MLSLSSSLTAAINAHTRRPAISLIAADTIQHFAQSIPTTNTEAASDLVATNDGNLVRVRLTRGTNPFAQTFQWQRITDPTNASQWQTWTVFAGSTNTMFEDGGCALSYNNGQLQAYAQQNAGGNAIYYWQSSNHGQTWSSSPATVLSPPSAARTHGIASAGRGDCFFSYDISGGIALGCSFWSGTAWSTLQTWTLPALTLCGGLAVAWLNNSYSLVYSDTSALKACSTNSAGTTWNALPDIAAASSTAISRINPRLAYFDGLFQLICIEADAGALTGTTYSYPRIRQSADLLHFSNGFILHDLPAIDSASLVKYTPNSTGRSTYVAATMDAIQLDPAYQSSDSTQHLDLSARILSYRREIEAGHPATCTLVLDNQSSQLTPFITQYGTGSYQPIGLNTSLIFSEGYYTGTLDTPAMPPTTPTTLQTAIYHIRQITFERTPTSNQITIESEDLTTLLDLVNRYQLTYINQPLSWLITEICARAGLFSLILPTTTQMSTVVPGFILHAGQHYRQALNELCQLGWLEYFLDATETLQFRELHSSDSSVWSYAPEIESLTLGSQIERANHTIVTGHAPTGAPTGSIINGEAYDDISQHALGREQLVMTSDPKLTSANLCAARATFLLQQAQRNQYLHTITVPHNPGLQPLDIVTLNDQAAPIGTGQSTTARIFRSLVTFQPEHAIYQLQLHLEGP